MNSGNRLISHLSSVALGLGALAIAVCAVMFAQGSAKPPDGADAVGAQDRNGIHTAETDISYWPEPARSSARRMIEEYGDPDQFSLQALFWYDNGPWAQTVVYREPGTTGTPTDQADIQQTIRYKIPKDMIAELKRFDPRIAVDAYKGELSVQSKSESTNYLVINLAQEIITEKRTVEEARAFYVKTLGLAASGKRSPYLERFVFELPRIDTIY